MSKQKWSLILMLVLLVPLPLLAGDEEAGVWMEIQTPRNSPTRLQLWIERDVSRDFGFFVSIGRESGGYEQYYLGPTWRPTDWLKVGLGLGRESVFGEFNGTRRGYWFEVEHEGFNAFGSFESGPSGRWHKVTATYAVTESVGIGAMKETDLGFGPRLEYNFGNGAKAQAWGAVLRSKGTTTPIVGFNISF